MAKEKQKEIPGTEIDVNPQIVQKAAELYEVRTARMALTREEKTLSVALIELCLDNDFTPEEFENISAEYAIRVKHTDTKVSVKSLVAKDEDEEE